MSTQRQERIPALTLGWRLRMSLGKVSVEQMADHLGVSRATISRWMADKGAPPKRAYVLQWALFTDVPADWLLGTAGIEPEPDTLAERTKEKVRRRVCRGGARQYAAAASVA